MSELSILELETEHAEVLPEREALSVHGGYVGGHNHVSVHQTAIAFAAGDTTNTNEAAAPTATATNIAVVGVG